MRKINIAISFADPQVDNQSIWTNGANQHVCFLYLMLKQLPYVENCWLVCNKAPDEMGAGMLVGDFAEDFRRYEQVINDTDFLIEMGAYILPKHAEAVRKRGGKMISYHFGNDYTFTVENISLGAHKNFLIHPHRIQFDELWVNAQYLNTCCSYLKHLYRAPAVIVPHLWLPIFVEKAAADAAERTPLGWGYKGRPDKAIIGIFEPNISVVKTGVIPFFAAAKFYEDNPTQVSNIYMTNTVRFLENKVFTHLVSGTQAGADRVASAEPRHTFVDFMSTYNAIVVSHQWENAMNYLYYETLYGGYPLVHNSPILRGAGYYYEAFDIDSGAHAIERAWETHDENLQEYKSRAADHLATVDPYEDAVIGVYDKRIRALFA